MVLRVAQETETEQGSKGAEHSAVRDIIGAFKTRFGSLQRPESGGNPFHGAGGCHSHGRLSIDHAAIPLVAWQDWIACNWGRPGSDQAARAFFEPPSADGFVGRIGQHPEFRPDHGNFHSRIEHPLDFFDALRRQFVSFLRHWRAKKSPSPSLP